jgi:Flp pilus assembly protein TadG
MATQRTVQASIKAWAKDERGAMGIIMTAMLPIVIGFASFAVDAPYIYAKQNALQLAADAAALAGDQWVGSYAYSGSGSSLSTPCTGASPPTLCTYAQELAAVNTGGTAVWNSKTSTFTITWGKDGTILQKADIVVGYWSSAGTFTAFTNASGQIANALQVTTRMTSANGNPISLFFAETLGFIGRAAGLKNFSLTASATAAFTSTNFGANGSQTNAVSDLIVVSDISGSFSSTLSQAKTAMTQCVKDFAVTGNSNSMFGLTLFTGSSPQGAVAANSPTAPAGGWGPQGWTSSQLTGSATTSPYTALTSATSNNFQTTLNTDVNGITDCSSFGGSYAQYSCSGSNIAAGMQSAINQFCPASGCAGGTLQMVIITDGVPNCSYVEPNTNGGATSKGNWGTSTITGQNCPAGQVWNGFNRSGQLIQETSAQTNAGDVQLLTDAQNLATAAGNLGITVSTIYYSGESGQGGGNTVDPNSSTGQTYAQELAGLTTLANTALTKKLGVNALSGQFFNEPTGSNLTTDMQKICVGGANANRPRLVI